MDFANSLIAIGATLLVGAPLLLIYLLPAAIAQQRKHEQWVPILILNALLGWTLIIWIVLLAWSFSSRRQR